MQGNGDDSPQRRTTILLAIALALATFAAYAGVFQNGFVDLDDQDYVVRNPYVRQGLTGATIAWSFTSFDLNMWHPLTWLSWALDSRLYGLDARGFHATNLVLHVACTLVLFALLRAATKESWRSAVVAALFALHPAHVESVAWVAERKDVLSTFFGFAALAAYNRYTSRPTLLRNFTVAALLALSLLAKPMFVTFPFLVLLWDFWPLERIGPTSRPATIGKAGLLLEKAPLFCLSMAISAMSLAAMHHTSNEATPSLASRLSNVAIAYVNYLWQTICPTRLCAFYPPPAAPPPWWQPVAAALTLVFVSLAAVYFGRRCRYFLTGWFWFLGTLVPVIGVVENAGHAMADRYNYVPSVGLFILAVWAIGDLARRSPRSVQRAVAAATVLTLVACAVLTWKQVSYWHDPVALWQHAIDVRPDNFRAKAYLAQQNAEQGNFKEARRLAEHSLEDRPNAFAHLVLGALDFKDRRPSEARRHFEQALALESAASGEAHNGLGAVLAAEGDLAAAEQHFRQSLAVDPYSATAAHNLGLALMRQGQFADAIRWLQAATQLDPRFTTAYESLATACAMDDRWTEALAACGTAVELDTNQPRYRRLLAGALWEINDLTEAKRQYRVADKLDDHWREAVRDETEKLLAEAPAGGYAAQKSVLLAKQLCEAADPAPPAADLDVLARAFQAAGRLDVATSTAQRAIKVAEAAGDQQLAASIRARLEQVSEDDAQR